MSDKKIILESILDKGVLPLFYCDSPTVSLEVIRTLYRGGIRALEYTNRGAAALENFTFLKKTLAKETPDLFLGIGTIKTAAEAHAFIKAGADFIVAPIVNPEVAAIDGAARMACSPAWLSAPQTFFAQTQQGPR